MDALTQMVSTLSEQLKVSLEQNRALQARIVELTSQLQAIATAIATILDTIARLNAENAALRQQLER